jgi:uncharacterized membrane protein (UPF0136 family)
MLKKTTSWAVMIYGLLLIVLGILGYTSAQSKLSLFMGSGSGLVLALCALAMFSHKKWGAYLALIVTTLLTGLFAIRYSLTGKSLPAILAVLSGAMLLYLLAQSAHWKRNA